MTCHDFLGDTSCIVSVHFDRSIHNVCRILQIHSCNVRLSDGGLCMLNG